MVLPKLAINSENISRLSQLELELYVGRVGLDDYHKDMVDLRDFLMAKTRVDVRPLPYKSDYRSFLHDILKEVSGIHDNFTFLREKIAQQCYSSEEVNSYLYNEFKAAVPVVLMTALFDGIYLGEPEDLRNFRAKVGSPKYGMCGLGKRIADIVFVD